MYFYYSTRWIGFPFLKPRTTSTHVPPNRSAWKLLYLLAGSTSMPDPKALFLYTWPYGMKRCLPRKASRLGHLYLRVLLQAHIIHALHEFSVATFSVFCDKGRRRCFLRFTSCMVCADSIQSKMTYLTRHHTALPMCTLESGQSPHLLLGLV